MNELQVFNFNENEVRTLLIDDEPYFVGKDLTDILGYKNGSRDINNHVESEDMLKYQISTSGQSREQLVVNESGMYALIFGSKLPEAKTFKRWVTKDVLPTIRKHGAYMTPETIEKTLTDPDFIIELATQLKDLQKQNNELAEVNSEMKPKALFADSVASSHTSILVGDLAKLLKQNGVDIGQNRLFEELRQDGFLIRRRGASYNTPTQKSMEMDLFEIKERTINNADGSTRITKTTKVTGKGQIYFINRYLKEKGEL